MRLVSNINLAVATFSVWSVSTAGVVLAGIDPNVIPPTTIHPGGRPLVYSSHWIGRGGCIRVNSYEKDADDFQQNKCGTYEMLPHIMPDCTGRDEIVPKVIHSVDKDGLLTPDHHSISGRYPEYKINHHGDASAKEYIREHCGEDAANAYGCFAPPSYRADLFRFCAMYAEGGVYFDSDVVPMVKELEDMYSTCSTASIGHDFPQDDVAHSGKQMKILASAPGAPIFKCAYESIVDHARRRYVPDNSLAITGPVLLHKCYMSHSDDVAVTYHDTRQAEWPWTGLRRGSNILATERPGSKAFQLKFGDDKNDYAFLFKEGKIYKETCPLDEIKAGQEDRETYCIEQYGPDEHDSIKIVQAHFGEHSFPMAVYENDAKEGKDSSMSVVIGAIGSYDETYTQKIVDTIRDQPVSPFIDVGANIGWYSLVAAKHGRFTYAIEPVESHRKLIEVSACLNDDIAKNLIVVPHAIGSESSIGKNDDGERISTTTLDELTETGDIFIGFEQQSILNLNVDGDDYLAMRGASESYLKKRVPHIILSKVNPRRLNSRRNDPKMTLKFFAFMEEAGYTMSDMQDRPYSYSWVISDFDQMDDDIDIKFTYQIPPPSTDNKKESKGEEKEDSAELELDAYWRNLQGMSMPTSPPTTSPTPDTEPDTPAPTDVPFTPSDPTDEPTSPPTPDTPDTLPPTDAPKGEDATVGGGAGNTAQGNAAVTAGGKENSANGSESSVGGGYRNTAGSTVVPRQGGDDVPTGFRATVSGGANNNAIGDRTTIAGGAQNNALGNDATISGGFQNLAIGAQSTIGGGNGNQATALKAMVGGGSNNKATGTRATVGGGGQNIAAGSESTVAGGQENFAGQQGSTVSGGYLNVANRTYSTVSGGQNNVASAVSAVVSGGKMNIASGQNSFIGGGIENEAAASASVIAGGNENILIGKEAFIGGGLKNTVTKQHSVIGGGKMNMALATQCTIGGGNSNVCYSDSSTILGGTKNVAGTEGNRVGKHSVVIGGRNNTAGKFGAVVLGGENNIANGTFSIAAGSMAHARNERSVVFNIENKDVPTFSEYDAEFKVKSKVFTIEIGDQKLQINASNIIRLIEVLDGKVALTKKGRRRKFPDLHGAARKGRDQPKKGEAMLYDEAQIYNETTTMTDDAEEYSEEDEENDHRSYYDPSCSANTHCAHLDGDCCPTIEGIVLGCCDGEDDTDDIVVTVDNDDAATPDIDDAPPRGRRGLRLRQAIPTAATVSSPSLNTEEEGEEMRQYELMNDEEKIDFLYDQYRQSQAELLKMQQLVMDLVNERK